MIVIAIVAGVLCQLISILVGIPSIVFYLIVGVILGPEILNMLDPALFGEGFETIIKLCVAIILFEAGLSLDKEEMKTHGKVILPLITVGALITMFGGAIFAKALLPITWQTALLFGSLVIVTGPTVIHPLLRRISVRPNIKHILEYEGVFIDPIGAIIAIFVFELVIQEASSIFHGIYLVLFRFGIGAVIGGVGGYLVSIIVKKFSIYMEDYQDLFVLAFALGIYSLSESIIAESGLMAAVASGAIVGNLNIPGEENLKKFKGKLSVLVISLLFVLLAASLELDYIRSLGIKGIIVVAALLLIVRPVQIFLTTSNSNLETKEKIFLSYISPRGIVAASIASIIGIEMAKRNLSGAEVIQGLVFLTIAVSVLFQGTTAGFVANLLGLKVENKKIVIVGANAFGRLLARLLTHTGTEVTLIDSNERLINSARIEGLNAIEGNSLDIDQLELTGISNAYSVVSVTTSDKVNVFVCRLAKADFGLKNATPVLNTRGDDELNLESVNKLGLDLAFGKPLGLFDIYSNIRNKEYTVFKFQAGKEKHVGKKISELFGKFDLIPLFINRPKSPPIICSLNTVVQDGDEITVLDLDPVSTELSFIGNNTKEIIDA